MKARAAIVAVIVTTAPLARAEPITLSLEPGSCTTTIDPVVLAGHVALEAPVDVVSPADARVHATWGEPPCDPAHVHVVLRDPNGAVLAGPVELSVAGLSPRLVARVVALWFGEAVRTLASTPREVQLVPPPPPELPPVATFVPPKAPARERPPPPPPPTARVHPLRAALIGSFGYAPSTTSSVASAMAALDLRPFGARNFVLQVDAGVSAVWTPFQVDLGLLGGGVALLLPFPLHPNVSLEIGLRATMSYVTLLRAEPGIESRGDQILTGGGGIVRALVHDARFGSMVEVELGGPFGGYKVHVTTAPDSDTVVFDGMRVDVRAGVTFE